MRRVAIQQGMESLRDDGWRLVREGRTTVDEVVRVTKDEQLTLADTRRSDAALEPEPDISALVK
jgi:hypothetical protein